MEEFSSELTEYLNKNVNEFKTPEVTAVYEFNLYIANSESPLKCVAYTNSKFQGKLKADLRRKVLTTLKAHPGKTTKIRLFFWVAAAKEGEIIPEERKRRVSFGVGAAKDYS